MAKRKHATALFEVIHSGDPSHKKLLNTPRWWFKKNGQTASTPPSAATGVKTSSSPEPVAPVSDEDDPTAGRDAVDHRIAPATSVSKPSTQSTIAYSSDPAPTRPGGVDLAVDADRQQITFKFSYTSAIIIAFSLLVAVGLAYLVGQKMSRGPQVALGGQSSEQLRAGPKNPVVLDVGQRNSNPQQQSPQREPEVGISSRGPENNPDNVEQPPGANGDTPDPNAPSKRVMNLNYVVVQSYPDQKGAEEARDALVKAGLGATIERGLKGWTKDWYIVVGLQGFQRASGPEYDAYIRKINDVSQQFSQRKRSFKAFQPMAFKWQGSVG